MDPSRTADPRRVQKLFAAARLLPPHDRALLLDRECAGDAGLVSGRVRDAIDDEGARFVGWIKINAALDALAEPYLKRPAWPASRRRSG
jgi:hypothetical protein